MPVAPDELRARLLRLNEPAVPWQVIDGAPEGVDVMVEWKTADPYWQSILNEVEVNGTFKTFLRFHTDVHEVRSRDRCYRWERSLDVNTNDQVHQAWENGQLRSTAEGTVNGQHYRFDTKEFKDVLKKAVTDAGWIYRAVVMRKL